MGLYKKLAEWVGRKHTHRERRPNRMSADEWGDDGLTSAICFSCLLRMEGFPPESVPSRCPLCGALMGDSQSTENTR